MLTGNFIPPVTLPHNWYGPKYTPPLRAVHLHICSPASTFQKNPIFLWLKTFSCPKIRNWTSMKPFASMKGGKSRPVDTISWTPLTTFWIPSDSEDTQALKFTTWWLMRFKTCLMPLFTSCQKQPFTASFTQEIQLKPSPKVLDSDFVTWKVSLIPSIWITRSISKNL